MTRKGHTDKPSRKAKLPCLENATLTLCLVVVVVDVEFLVVLKYSHSYEGIQ